jgi:hypothetical protein
VPEKVDARTEFSARKRKNENIPDSCVFGLDKVSIMRKFKLLGVIIDDELSFKDHVEGICGKVNAGLFSIKSKCFLSMQTKIQFFKTLMLPHFDYCSSLCMYYSMELHMKLVKL